MKRFLILVIFALMLGQCFADTPKPTPTQDPWKDCKDQFEVKYDKFKDVTIFKPKNMRAVHKIKSKGGDEVGLWIIASYPGQTYDPAKPVDISLVFFRLDVTRETHGGTQSTGKSNYKDCSTCILIADGVKMDLGTLKYDVKSSGSLRMTYLDQTLTGPLTLQQLTTLAKAKTIEGELCETELTFNKDQACILNQALNFFK